MSQRGFQAREIKEGIREKRRWAACAPLRFFQIDAIESCIKRLGLSRGSASASAMSGFRGAACRAGSKAEFPLSFMTILFYECSTYLFHGPRAIKKTRLLGDVPAFDHTVLLSCLRSANWPPFFKYNSMPSAARYARAPIVAVGWWPAN